MTTERRISHNGINFEGTLYWSKDLETMIGLTASIDDRQPLAPAALRCRVGDTDLNVVAIVHQ